MTPKERFISVNPYTGETLAERPASSAREIDAALSRLYALACRPAGISERAEALRACARAFADPVRAEALARTVTAETGKLIREARAETQKCADAFAWYAETAEEAQAPRTVSLPDGGKARVALRPLPGALLAIMPWNYPLWQAVRALAPLMQTGGVMLLKHAPGVQGTADALRETLEAALGRENCPLEIIRTPTDQTLALMDDPRVAAVTLTGGESAGRAVGAAAGRALKPSVLELGGSDPYVVLADADPDLAAAACASARLVNAGQSCIGAKRFIVAEAVYDAFMTRFMAEMSARLPGDPMEERTGLAPLAGGSAACARAAEMVRRSVASGARLLMGGGAAEGSPFFPASVLEACGPGVPAFDEETFFPLAAVCRARDEAEALQLANASVYGLGGAVFSRDPERALRFADGMRGGGCAVNTAYRSDPRLPFGGSGRSGYGRELGTAGAEAFAELRVTYL